MHPRGPLVLVVGLQCLAVSSTARADEDPWLGPDKAAHFGASAVLAAGGYATGAVAFDRRTSALMLGGGVALSAGIGKELYDAAGHGDPSAKDLVWDVAGTATGLTLAWLIDWIARGDLDEAGSAGPSTVHAAIRW